MCKTPKIITPLLSREIDVTSQLICTNYGGHLNKNWIEQDFPRYLLAYGTPTRSKAKNSFTTLHKCKAEAKRSSLLDCLELKTLILHSTSGRRLSSPSSGPVVDLAFSTIGCQTPQSVYSRKSIAGFKLSKFSLLGAKTTLRNQLKYEFFYKLYFLGARFSNTFLSKSTINESLPCLPPVRQLAPNLLLSSKLRKSRYCQRPHVTFTLLQRKVPDKATGLREKSNPDTHKLVERGFRPRSMKLFSDLCGSGKVTHVSRSVKKGDFRQKQQVPFLTTSLAIKNAFIFNELDILDYDSFSKIEGFEIVFIKRPLLNPSAP